MQEINNVIYPNAICEDAKISEEYSNFANELSRLAITQFLELCKIPHASGHTEEMRKYISNFGREHGAHVICDSGNVIIDVDASKGCENSPKVIFQCHYDMVAVGSKDNIDFNPSSSSIKPIFEKDTGVIHTGWKSTLGADDGYGVSVSLAMIVLSKNKDAGFEHGPLRFIFTYDEETTQEGAENLTVNDLDADYLINMDSIYVGEIITSSAGGFSGTTLKKFELISVNANSTLIKISLIGLCGGHSGEDIHKKRANAILILLDYLNTLIENNVDFNIKHVKAGDRVNSIPDKLNFEFVVNEKDRHFAIDLWKSVLDKAKKTYSDGKTLTDDINITENFTGMVLTNDDSKQVFRFINKMPIGLIETDESSFPITSNNLGVLKIKDDWFNAELLFRSSIQQKIHAAIKSTIILCNEEDFDLTVTSIYPAWKSSKDSQLANLFLDAFKNVADIKAKVRSIHAGLEVGNFALLKPELNIVSIGCDVINEHNIKETLFTKSIPVFCATILYVLKHISCA